MPDQPRGASASIVDIKNRYRSPAMAGSGSDFDEMAGVTGLAAELLKYHNERALLHRMLTAAGIPETTGQGEPICLIGRLGVAVGRL